MLESPGRPSRTSSLSAHPLGELTRLVLLHIICSRRLPSPYLGSGLQPSQKPRCILSLPPGCLGSKLNIRHLSPPPSARASAVFLNQDMATLSIQSFYQKRGHVLGPSLPPHVTSSSSAHPTGCSFKVVHHVSPPAQSLPLWTTLRPCLPNYHNSCSLHLHPSPPPPEVCQ